MMSACSSLSRFLLLQLWPNLGLAWTPSRNADVLHFLLSFCSASDWSSMEVDLYLVKKSAAFILIEAEDYIREKEICVVVLEKLSWR